MPNETEMADILTAWTPAVLVGSGDTGARLLLRPGTEVTVESIVLCGLPYRRSSRHAEIAASNGRYCVAVRDLRAATASCVLECDGKSHPRCDACRGARINSRRFGRACGPSS